MLRRILIVALIAGVSGCAAFGSRPLAVNTAASPAPKPAVGLWAMLDPGCAKPSLADIRTWPACASPFWITHDKSLLVLETGAHGRAIRDVSYVADYNLAPGRPLIAQVGTQKDGYMFVALTRLAKDRNGRLIEAVGAAIACPQPKTAGELVLKPNLNGCDLDSLASVRKAALAALQDRSALAEVAWIAPGAP